MTRHMILPSRRLFLIGAGAGLVAACSGHSAGETPAIAGNPEGEFHDTRWRKLSEADWRARLTPEQFRVLREEGTERAMTSPLNDEHREGIYHCAGCDLPLFASDTKFESGTGWPSFYDHLPGALGTKPDNTLWMQRTEYHCARCLGHQGHVFEDGPRPTGLRYCNNGVALTFRPA